MKRSVGVGDRGSVTVEFSAVFPVALVIILLSFEALMAATTVERVENAARTGARTASQQQEVSACRGAALDAMPGWLNDKTVAGTASGGDGVSCTVQAKVPLLWPGIPLDFSVVRTVTMPLG
jgi:Flp pilus assembly protein TadG